MKFFVLPIFDGVKNGRAFNILIGGCRLPPRFKYWMSMHYDTIEGGQNKILILYPHDWLDLCYFCTGFIAKNSITSVSMASFQ